MQRLQALQSLQGINHSIMRNIMLEAKTIEVLKRKIVNACVELTRIQLNYTSSIKSNAGKPEEPFGIDLVFETCTNIELRIYCNKKFETQISKCVYFHNIFNEISNISYLEKDVAKILSQLDEIKTLLKKHIKLNKKAIQK